MFIRGKETDVRIAIILLVLYVLHIKSADAVQSVANNTVLSPKCVKITNVSFRYRKAVCITITTLIGIDSCPGGCPKGQKCHTESGK